MPLLVVFVRQPKASVPWWIASAFAVSFAADSLAHVVPPIAVSVLYPVTQAFLAAAMLLTAGDAMLLLAALVSAGVASAALYDGITPDILLTTVAFGSVAGIAYRERDKDVAAFRVVLLVYFGAGLLAWLAFAGWPSWTTYALYQLTRVVGIALFCVACWRPQPALRVA